MLNNLVRMKNGSEMGSYDTNQDANHDGRRAQIPGTVLQEWSPQIPPQFKHTFRRQQCESRSTEQHSLSSRIGTETQA